MFSFVSEEFPRVGEKGRRVLPVRALDRALKEMWGRVELHPLGVREPSGGVLDLAAWPELRPIIDDEGHQSAETGLRAIEAQIEQLVGAVAEGGIGEPATNSLALELLDFFEELKGAYTKPLMQPMGNMGKWVEITAARRAFARRFTLSMAQQAVFAQQAAPREWPKKVVMKTTKKVEEVAVKAAAPVPEAPKEEEALYEQPIGPEPKPTPKRRRGVAPRVVLPKKTREAWAQMGRMAAAIEKAVVERNRAANEVKAEAKLRLSKASGLRNQLRVVIGGKPMLNTFAKRVQTVINRRLEIEVEDFARVVRIVNKALGTSRLALQANYKRRSSAGGVVARLQRLVPRLATLRRDPQKKVKRMSLESRLLEKETCSRRTRIYKLDQEWRTDVARYMSETQGDFSPQPMGETIVKKVTFKEVSIDEGYESSSSNSGWQKIKPVKKTKARKVGKPKVAGHAVAIGEEGGIETFDLGVRELRTLRKAAKTHLKRAQHVHEVHRYATREFVSRRSCEVVNYATAAAQGAKHDPKCRSVWGDQANEDDLSFLESLEGEKIPEQSGFVFVRAPKKEERVIEQKLDLTTPIKYTSEELAWSKDCDMMQSWSADVRAAAGVARTLRPRYNGADIGDLRRERLEAGMAVPLVSCGAKYKHDDIILITKKVSTDRASDIKHVEQALKEAALYIKGIGIKEVHMPPIECGLNGKVWSQIEPLVRKHISPECQVVVHDPHGVTGVFKDITKTVGESAIVTDWRLGGGKVEEVTCRHAVLQRPVEGVDIWSRLTARQIRGTCHLQRVSSVDAQCLSVGDSGLLIRKDKTKNHQLVEGWTECRGKYYAIVAGVSKAGLIQNALNPYHKTEEFWSKGMSAAEEDVERGAIQDLLNMVGLGSVPEPKASRVGRENKNQRKKKRAAAAAQKKGQPPVRNRRGRGRGAGGGAGLARKEVNKKIQIARDEATLDLGLSFAKMQLDHINRTTTDVRRLVGRGEKAGRSMASASGIVVKKQKVQTRKQKAKSKLMPSLLSIVALFNLFVTVFSATTGTALKTLTQVKTDLVKYKHCLTSNQKAEEIWCDNIIRSCRSLPPQVLNLQKPSEAWPHSARELCDALFVKVTGVRNWFYYNKDLYKCAVVENGEAKPVQKVATVADTIWNLTDEVTEACNFVGARWSGDLLYDIQSDIPGVGSGSACAVPALQLMMHDIKRTERDMQTFPTQEHSVGEWQNAYNKLTTNLTVPPSDEVKCADVCDWILSSNDIISREQRSFAECSAECFGREHCVIIDLGAMKTVIGRIISLLTGEVRRHRMDMQAAAFEDWCRKKPNLNTLESAVKIHCQTGRLLHRITYLSCSDFEGAIANSLTGLGLKWPACNPHIVMHEDQSWVHCRYYQQEWNRIVDNRPECEQAIVEGFGPGIQRFANAATHETLGALVAESQVLGAIDPLSTVIGSTTTARPQRSTNDQLSGVKQYLGKWYDQAAANANMRETLKSVPISDRQYVDADCTCSNAKRPGWQTEGVFGSAKDWGKCCCKDYGFATDSEPWKCDYVGTYQNASNNVTLCNIGYSWHVNKGGVEELVLNSALLKDMPGCKPGCFPLKMRWHMLRRQPNIDGCLAEVVNSICEKQMISSLSATPLQISFFQDVARVQTRDWPCKVEAPCCKFGFAKQGDKDGYWTSWGPVSCFCKQGDKKFEFVDDNTSNVTKRAGLGIGCGVAAWAVGRFTSGIVGFIGMLACATAVAYADCGVRGDVIRVASSGGDTRYQSIVTIKEGDCLIMGAKRILIKSLKHETTYRSFIEVPWSVDATVAGAAHGCCQWFGLGDRERVCDKTWGCSQGKSFRKCSRQPNNHDKGLFKDCGTGEDVYVNTEWCIKSVSRGIVMQPDTTKTKVSMELTVLNEDGTNEDIEFDVGDGHYGDTISVVNLVPQAYARPDWIMVNGNQAYCGLKKFSSFGDCECPVGMNDDCLTEQCLGLKWLYTMGEESFKISIREDQALSWIGTNAVSCGAGSVTADTRKATYTGGVVGATVDIIGVFPVTTVSNPCKGPYTMALIASKSGSYETTKVAVTSGDATSCVAEIDCPPCGVLGTPRETINPGSSSMFEVLCGVRVPSVCTINHVDVKPNGDFVRDWKYGSSFKQAIFNSTAVQEYFSSFGTFWDRLKNINLPNWNLPNLDLVGGIKKLAVLVVGGIVLWVGFTNNSPIIMAAGGAMCASAYILVTANTDAAVATLTGAAIVAQYQERYNVSNICYATVMVVLIVEGRMQIVQFFTEPQSMWLTARWNIERTTVAIYNAVRFTHIDELIGLIDNIVAVIQVGGFLYLFATNGNAIFVTIIVDNILHPVSAQYIWEWALGRQVPGQQMVRHSWVSMLAARYWPDEFRLNCAQYEVSQEMAPAEHAISTFHCIDNGKHLKRALFAFAASNITFECADGDEEEADNRDAIAILINTHKKSNMTQRVLLDWFKNINKHTVFKTKPEEVEPHTPTCLILTDARALKDWENIMVIRLVNTALRSPGYEAEIVVDEEDIQPALMEVNAALKKLCDDVIVIKKLEEDNDYDCIVTVAIKGQRTHNRLNVPLSKHWPKEVLSSVDVTEDYGIVTVNRDDEGKTDYIIAIPSAADWQPKKFDKAIEKIGEWLSSPTELCLTSIETVVEDVDWISDVYRILQRHYASCAWWTIASVTGDALMKRGFSKLKGLKKLGTDTFRLNERKDVVINPANTRAFKDRLDEMMQLQNFCNLKRGMGRWSKLSVNGKPILVTAAHVVSRELKIAGTWEGVSGGEYLLTMYGGDVAVVTKGEVYNVSMIEKLFDEIKSRLDSNKICFDHQAHNLTDIKPWGDGCSCLAPTRKNHKGLSGALVRFTVEGNDKCRIVCRSDSTRLYMDGLGIASSYVDSVTFKDTKDPASIILENYETWPINYSWLMTDNIGRARIVRSAQRDDAFAYLNNVSHALMAAMGVEVSSQGIKHRPTAAIKEGVLNYVAWAQLKVGEAMSRVTTLREAGYIFPGLVWSKTFSGHTYSWHIDARIEEGVKTARVGIKLPETVLAIGKKQKFGELRGDQFTVDLSDAEDDMLAELYRVPEPDAETIELVQRFEAYRNRYAPLADTTAEDGGAEGVSGDKENVVATAGSSTATTSQVVSEATVVAKSPMLSPKQSKATLEQPKSNWHEHDCTKCQGKYKHVHSLGKNGHNHGQRAFQCPYEKCEWFYGKGDETQRKNLTLAEQLPRGDKRKPAWVMPDCCVKTIFEGNVAEIFVRRHSQLPHDTRCSFEQWRNVILSAARAGETGNIGHFDVVPFRYGFENMFIIRAECKLIECAHRDEGWGMELHRAIANECTIEEMTQNFLGLSEAGLGKMAAVADSLDLAYRMPASSAAWQKAYDRYTKDPDTGMRGACEAVAKETMSIAQSSINDIDESLRVSEPSDEADFLDDLNELNGVKLVDKLDWLVSKLNQPKLVVKLRNYLIEKVGDVDKVEDNLIKCKAPPKTEPITFATVTVRWSAPATRSGFWQIGVMSGNRILVPKASPTADQISCIDLFAKFIGCSVVQHHDWEIHQPSFQFKSEYCKHFTTLLGALKCGVYDDLVKPLIGPLDLQNPLDPDMVVTRMGQWGVGDAKSTSPLKPVEVHTKRTKTLVPLENCSLLSPGTFSFGTVTAYWAMKSGSWYTWDENLYSAWHVTRANAVLVTTKNVDGSTQTFRGNAITQATDELRDTVVYGKNISKACFKAVEPDRLCYIVNFKEKKKMPCRMERADMYQIIRRTAEGVEGRYYSKFKAVARVGTNLFADCESLNMPGWSGCPVFTQNDKGDVELVTTYCAWGGGQAEGKSCWYGNVSAEITLDDQYFDQCAEQICNKRPELGKYWLCDAPTGTGKTTRLTVSLVRRIVNHQVRYDTVVLVQPKRIYVTNTWNFLTKSLLTELEQVISVTYKVGTKEGEVSTETWGRGQNVKLVIMTYGCFNNEQANYSKANNILLLDEFHERTDQYVIESEFYTNHSSCAANKVLLSATPINSVPAVKLLEGTPHPRSMYSRTEEPLAKRNKLTENDKRTHIWIDGAAVADTPQIRPYKWGFSRRWYNKGRILIFVPTVAATERVEKSLKEENGDSVNVVRFYSGCGVQIADIGLFDIIVSTNIAESSVTIPGLKVVVDFGLTNNPHVDLVIEKDTNTISFSRRMVIEHASNNNRDQRKGRCGRDGVGVYCYVPSQTVGEITEYPTESMLGALVRFTGACDNYLRRITETQNEKMVESVNDVITILPEELNKFFGSTTADKFSAEHIRERLDHCRNLDDDQVSFYLKFNWTQAEWQQLEAADALEQGWASTVTRWKTWLAKYEKMCVFTENTEVRIDGRSYYICVDTPFTAKYKRVKLTPVQEDDVGENSKTMIGVIGGVLFVGTVLIQSCLNSREAKEDRVITSAWSCSKAELGAAITALDTVHLLDENRWSFFRKILNWIKRGSSCVINMLCCIRRGLARTFGFIGPLWRWLTSWWSSTSKWADRNIDLNSYWAEDLSAMEAPAIELLLSRNPITIEEWQHQDNKKYVDSFKCYCSYINARRAFLTFLKREGVTEYKGVKLPNFEDGIHDRIISGVEYDSATVQFSRMAQADQETVLFNYSEESIYMWLKDLVSSVAERGNMTPEQCMSFWGVYMGATSLYNEMEECLGPVATWFITAAIHGVMTKLYGMKYAVASITFKLVKNLINYRISEWLYEGDELNIKRKAAKRACSGTWAAAFGTATAGLYEALSAVNLGNSAFVENCRVHFPNIFENAEEGLGARVSVMAGKCWVASKCIPKALAAGPDNAFAGGYVNFYQLYNMVKFCCDTGRWENLVSAQTATILTSMMARSSTISISVAAVCAVLAAMIQTNLSRLRDMGTIVALDGKSRASSSAELDHTVAGKIFSVAADSIDTALASLAYLAEPSSIIGLFLSIAFDYACNTAPALDGTGLSAYLKRFRFYDCAGLNPMTQLLIMIQRFMGTMLNGFMFENSSGAWDAIKEALNPIRWLNALMELKKNVQSLFESDGIDENMMGRIRRLWGKVKGGFDYLYNLIKWVFAKIIEIPATMGRAVADTFCDRVASRIPLLGRLFVREAPVDTEEEVVVDYISESEYVKACIMEPESRILAQAALNKGAPLRKNAFEFPAWFFSACRSQGASYRFSIYETKYNVNPLYMTWSNVDLDRILKPWNSRIDDWLKCVIAEESPLGKLRVSCHWDQSEWFICFGTAYGLTLIAPKSNASRHLVAVSLVSPAGSSLYMSTIKGLMALLFANDLNTYNDNCGLTNALSNVASSFWEDYAKSLSVKLQGNLEKMFSRSPVKSAVLRMWRNASRGEMNRGGATEVSSAIDLLNSLKMTRMPQLSEKQLRVLTALVGPLSKEEIVKRWIKPLSEERWTAVYDREAFNMNDFAEEGPTVISVSNNGWSAGVEMDERVDADLVVLSQYTDCTVYVRYGDGTTWQIHGLRNNTRINAYVVIDLVDRRWFTKNCTTGRIDCLGINATMAVTVTKALELCDISVPPIMNIRDGIEACWSAGNYYMPQHFTTALEADGVNDIKPFERLFEITSETGEKLYSMAFELFTYVDDEWVMRKAGYTKPGDPRRGMLMCYNRLTSSLSEGVLMQIRELWTKENERQKKTRYIDELMSHSSNKDKKKADAEDNSLPLPELTRADEYACQRFLAEENGRSLWAKWHTRRLPEHHEKVLNAVFDKIDDAINWLSFDTHTEGCAAGVIAPELIRDPVWQTGFFPEENCSASMTKELAARVELGIPKNLPEMRQHLQDTCDYARQCASNLSANEWLALKNMCVYELPKRINTLNISNKYNAERVYASRAAIKFQQLWEASPTTFQGVSNIFAPCCGLGGETQFFSWLYKNQKNTRVFYSSLNQPGHAMPNPTLMRVPGSKVDIIPVAPIDVSSGDVRDLQVLEAYRRIGAAGMPADLLVFDFGEASTNLDKQVDWWLAERKGVSILDAVIEMIKMQPKGGRAIVKMLGVHEKQLDLLQQICGQYTKAKVVCCKTTPLCSTEWFLLLEGRNDKGQLDERAVRGIIEGAYLALEKRMRHFAINLDFIVGKLKNTANRKLTLQALMSQPMLRVKVLKQAFNPGSEALYTEQLRLATHRLDDQYGLQSAPAGQKCDIVTSTGHMKMEWQPNWGPRIEQTMKYACKSSRKKYEIKPVDRAWNYIHGLGQFRQDNTPEKVKGQTNGLIRSYAQEVFGWDQDNSTVGFTQGSKSFIDAAIKRRIDVLIRDATPEHKRKLIECADTLISEFGKKQIGALQYLDQKEVENMLNWSGSGGIFDKDGKIRRYIDNNPNWYSECMEVVRKMEVAGPNTPAVGSYATIRFKDEPKLKKIAGEDGELIEEFIASGEGAVKASDPPQLSDWNFMVPRFITYFDIRARLAHVIIAGGLIKSHHEQKLYKGSINGLPPYLTGNILATCFDLCQSDQNAGSTERDYEPMGINVTISETGKTVDNDERTPWGSRADDACAIEGDYSNLDATLSVFSRQLECYFFKRFFKGAAATAFENMCKDMTYAICFADNGLSWLRAGMRGSGEIMTSIGNTFLCAVYLRCAVSDVLGVDVKALNATMATVAVKVQQWEGGEPPVITAASVASNITIKEEPLTTTVNGSILWATSCDLVCNTGFSKIMRDRYVQPGDTYSANKMLKRIRLDNTHMNKPRIGDVCRVWNGDSYDIIMFVKNKWQDRTSKNVYAAVMQKAAEMAVVEKITSINMPWIGTSGGKISFGRSKDLILKAFENKGTHLFNPGFLAPILRSLASVDIRAFWRPIEVVVWGKPRVPVELTTTTFEAASDEYDEGTVINEGKNVKWKYYELPALITFNDGDDSVIITKRRAGKQIEKDVAGKMEQYGLTLRYSTNAGVKYCPRFSDLSFCSNTYQPVLINPGKEVNKPLLETGSTSSKRFKAGEIAPGLRVCLKAAKEQGSMLKFLPYRPISQLVGKLVCTLKGSTRRWDLTNPEVVELTRARACSYLLMYPHLRTVRAMCLAILSVTGDGRVDMEMNRRRWGDVAFPVKDSIASALYSMYGTNTLDNIGLVSYSLEMTTHLKVLEDNSALTGRTCVKNVSALMFRTLSWMKHNQAQYKTIWRLWQSKYPDVVSMCG